MKKILIFQMGDMAYSSTRVFAEELGKELERKDIAVEYFDAKKESPETLEALAGKSFDAVIDFNSRLPGIIKDEKGYLLDYIDAPFFNYILDHPIYHHGNLEHQLKNYHVISIDEGHTSYIKQWYPHIQSVQTFPIGAIQAQNIDKEKKDSHILFPATYLNPRDYYEMIGQLPKMMKDTVLEIIDILLADTACTYENAAMQVYERSKQSMNFPLFAQSNFLADIYVRAYFREKVLETAANAGLPITVCGEKYQESRFVDYKNVTVLQEVSYRESIELIAQSAFVLNVMPWFKAGIHDRVLHAMRNRAVCITDSSSLMQRYFTEQKDYIGYSLERLEALPEQLHKILSDTQKQYEIAESAAKKAEKMTFARQAEFFASFI